VLRAHPRRPLVVGDLVLLLSVLPNLALASPRVTWEIATAAALGGAGLIILDSAWDAVMPVLIPELVRSRVSFYDWLFSLVVVPGG
jgi:hypothetical protein